MVGKTDLLFKEQVFRESSAEQAETWSLGTWRPLLGIFFQASNSFLVEGGVIFTLGTLSWRA
jgi:hypothetical protein